ncbi:MAG: right-handed parallel beta-helix repeat-containing protein [Clostridia bacterium]|nr:right-handed parallel beta-helix repeat-containing protein [Clostridia bacterium]
MKRLLALIIAMLLLTGCAFFDGDVNDGLQPDDNGSTGEVEGGGDENKDQLPPSDENEENDHIDDEKNEKNPPVDDTDDKKDEPEDKDEGDTDKNLEQATINDYIADLIGSEYCSDPDFLNFVINMDNRAVGKVIYAGPDGDGEGTMSSPASLEDAVDMAKAGDTVYLRGGEYIFKEAIWISDGGKKDAYITIKSYPGEQAVLTTTPENIEKYRDGSEYLFFGFDEGAAYVIFEDLEIKDATYKNVIAFACYDGGQNHLIFKNIKVHNLNTTKVSSSTGCNAFLFLGEKKNPINNIMLINNECYDLTLGYSEAISFAGNCEYCYVINNSVHDCTNIGIDFYGNAEYCSDESLDQARYSVAAYNTVYNCNSPYADCAGIYVDGGKYCLVEGNYIYSCQYGIEIGSEELKEEYPVTDIIVRNNILKGNTVCALRVGGYDKKSSGTVMNCYVYNNSFVNNASSHIIISKADNLVLANNIFIGQGIYVETEFDKTYTKNLKFYNNCFNLGGKSFALYGDEIDVNALNTLYGRDNFAEGISLDEHWYPDVVYTGCDEYTSKYDFHLCIREYGYIGAVEKGEK